MKRVDSDALGIISRSLGLTGTGAATTEFYDGALDQVLEVGPLVRRGRTAARTQGLFTGLMENVHAAANTQITRVTPYVLGVGAVAPYPDPVPAQFDVWLLGAIMRQMSGTGTVSALLSIQYSVQGWGEDQAGAAVVRTIEMPLAFWDTLITEGLVFGIHAGISGPWTSIGLRLPRVAGTELQFRSTSSALSTYNCQVLLGLFPVALGQDGIV